MKRLKDNFEEIIKNQNNLIKQIASKQHLLHFESSQRKATEPSLNLTEFEDRQLKKLSQQKAKQEANAGKRL